MTSRWDTRGVRGGAGFYLIASAVIVVTGCGGGGSGTNSVNSTQASPNTGEQHLRRAESGAQTVPLCRPGKVTRFHGRLLPAIPDGLGATGDNLAPQTNMWLMHDCHHFTAVGAGANPAHRADGRFTVYRSDHRGGRGSVRLVVVPNTGAVTITKAPVGVEVETPAQAPNDIEFKSKSGVTGTLHLKEDTVTLNRAATHRRDRPVPCRNRAYGDVGYRYPGSIRPAVGKPYVGPGETWDETNMWWASDCHILTVVTAGSDGDRHADGALVIQRTHYENPTHPHITEKKVNVPSGGVLEITKAPLGPSVETWAQRRGNIEFKGKNGITGTLHLADDTVTLNK
jgi:hypothetical protein